MIEKKQQQQQKNLTKHNYHDLSFSLSAPLKTSSRTIVCTCSACARVCESLLVVLKFCPNQRAPNRRFDDSKSFTTCRYLYPTNVPIITSNAPFNWVSLFLFFKIRAAAVTHTHAVPLARGTHRCLPFDGIARTELHHDCHIPLLHLQIWTKVSFVLQSFFSFFLCVRSDALI